jgi:hypothetical protein
MKYDYQDDYESFLYEYSHPQRDDLSAAKGIACSILLNALFGAVIGLFCAYIFTA